MEVSDTICLRGGFDNDLIFSFEEIKCFCRLYLVVFNLHSAICVLREKCSGLWMELKSKKRDDGRPKRMG